jgi:hypothetical protein
MHEIGVLIEISTVPAFCCRYFPGNPQVPFGLDHVVENSSLFRDSFLPDKSLKIGHAHHIDVIA